MSEPSTGTDEANAKDSLTEETQETVNEPVQDEKPLSATEVPRKGKRGRPRKNFAEVECVVNKCNMLRSCLVQIMVANFGTCSRVISENMRSFGED